MSLKSPSLMVSCRQKGRCNGSPADCRRQPAHRCHRPIVGLDVRRASSTHVVGGAGAGARTGLVGRAGSHVCWASGVRVTDRFAGSRFAMWYPASSSQIASPTACFGITFPSSTRPGLFFGLNTSRLRCPQRAAIVRPCRLSLRGPAASDCGFVRALLILAGLAGCEAASASTSF